MNPKTANVLKGLMLLILIFGLTPSARAGIGDGTKLTSSEIAKMLTFDDRQTFEPRYQALRALVSGEITQEQADALIASITTHYGTGDAFWINMVTEVIGSFADTDGPVLNRATMKASRAAYADPSTKTRAIEARKTFLRYAPAYGLDLKSEAGAAKISRLAMEGRAGPNAEDFKFSKIEPGAKLARLINPDRNFETRFYSIQAASRAFIGLREVDLRMGANREIRRTKIFDQDLNLIDDGEVHYYNGEPFVSWNESLARTCSSLFGL